jgi:hypothetical protein
MTSGTSSGGVRNWLREREGMIGMGRGCDRVIRGAERGMAIELA